ncbi:MAG: hypothetical protein WA687_08740 [Solirubrobacterales bacterium]
MQGAEATRCNPAPYRAGTQATSNQLATGDDAVLTIRKRRQLSLTLRKRPASMLT